MFGKMKNIADVYQMNNNFRVYIAKIQIYGEANFSEGTAGIKPISKHLA